MHPFAHHYNDMNRHIDRHKWIAMLVILLSYQDYLYTLTLKPLPVESNMMMISFEKFLKLKVRAAKHVRIRSIVKHYISVRDKHPAFLIQAKKNTMSNWSKSYRQNCMIIGLLDQHGWLNKPWYNGQYFLKFYN